MCIYVSVCFMANYFNLYSRALKYACMFKERVFRNTSSIHRVAYYYADYGLFLRVIFYLLRNFISSCHLLLIYVYTYLAAFQSFRLSESWNNWRRNVWSILSLASLGSLIFSLARKNKESFLSLDPSLHIHLSSVLKSYSRKSLLT